MARWLQIVLIIGLAGSASADPFLPSEIIEAFQDAPVITAQLVDPMPFTPAFRPEAGRYQIEIALNSNERELLLAALRAAQTIDPVSRLKECRYLPGITFSVTQGERSHAAILCLNCDVWAFDTRSGSASRDPVFAEEKHPKFDAPQRLTRFGDSRPQREALWGLFNALKAQIVAKSEEEWGLKPFGDGEKKVP